MNSAAQLLLFVYILLKCTLVLALLAAFALRLLLPLTLRFTPPWSFESISVDHRDCRPLTRRTTLLAAALAGLVLAGFASAQVRDGEVKAAPARPEASAGNATDPTPTAPTVQVAIESWLIKIGQNDFEARDLSQYEAAHPLPVSPTSDVNHWIGRLDVPAVLRALALKAGYELLSQPAIIVRSGRRTVMMVGQELRYPQNYSATSVPQNLTTRNVGLELEVTPTVAADGHTIKLHLNPRVTEFEGWVRYGTKGDQPIFSTREMDTEVAMEDGSTLVMGGLAMGDNPISKKALTPDGMGKLVTGNANDPKKRMLLLIISAGIVRPGGMAKK